MMASMFDVPRQIPLWGALWMLFFIRPAVAFVVLPATSEPAMTATTRHLLCVSFAAHVAMGASPATLEALATPQFLATVAVREALIGFTIGFAAGQGFWVAQSVGALVDNLAGYNNVQLINPSSPEQNTPVSDVMLQMFVAVFWTSGGMLLLLGVIGETYRWWPVLDPLPQWPAVPEALAGIGLTHLMRMVVSLSMPILFLLAFVDVGMGLVARAAKNADTSPLATPLKSAVALLAMVLFSSVFLADIRHYLSLAELPAVLARWHSLR
ncbi:EscT/YscT/HrcT family type III secretion system export apparatus protein [Xylophilus rhododendri]|uniref:EscT/YscT/HrcT family type III secretion system export apparatus protein n=1 Tax=Xylophilus rhododendri TaxID=2697032 RepID=A0A857JA51_9BURK|nr:type III secretion system export apparatus subunit SctT [Xylophilus rhododendri]QHJ00012.1 EscT/YscT/HrcT family type III secretion system export apparatus protein [Xylophilus rhododendri]